MPRPKLSGPSIPSFHRAGRGRVLVRLGGEEVGRIENMRSHWRYDGLHGPLTENYLLDLKIVINLEFERRASNE